jgi:hypothetical protein
VNSRRADKRSASAITPGGGCAALIHPTSHMFQLFLNHSFGDFHHPDVPMDESGLALNGLD